MRAYAGAHALMCEEPLILAEDKRHQSPALAGLQRAFTRPETVPPPPERAFGSSRRRRCTRKCGLPPPRLPGWCGRGPPLPGLRHPLPGPGPLPQCQNHAGGVRFAPTSAAKSRTSSSRRCRFPAHRAGGCLRQPENLRHPAAGPLRRLGAFSPSRPAPWKITASSGTSPGRTGCAPSPAIRRGMSDAAPEDTPPPPGPGGAARRRVIEPLAALRQSLKKCRRPRLCGGGVPLCGKPPAPCK